MNNVNSSQITDIVWVEGVEGVTLYSDYYAVPLHFSSLELVSGILKELSGDGLLYCYLTL